VWLSVWGEVQICMLLSWCHCNSVSCFSKIQIGFTFWVPAHPGNPGQIPKGRKIDVCVCCLPIFFIFCYYPQEQHPFNGPLSETTQVSQYQKGETSLDLLEQEIVSGSGISRAISKTASRPRQTTTQAPHHSVFYRPYAFPVAQPTA